MVSELDTQEVTILTALRKRQIGDVLILAAAMALSGVGTYHVSNWLAAVPPVTYHAVRAPLGPVKAGLPVIVEFQQERNRTCAADIYGWWVRRDTESADLRLPMVHGGYSKVSKEPYWQAVVLDAPPRAGTYEYRATLIHRCANGVFVTETPAAAVTVE